MDTARRGRPRLVDRRAWYARRASTEGVILPLRILSRPFPDGQPFSRQPELNLSALHLLSGASPPRAAFDHCLTNPYTPVILLPSHCHCLQRLRVVPVVQGQGMGATSSIQYMCKRLLSAARGCRRAKAGYRTDLMHESTGVSFSPLRSCPYADVPSLQPKTSLASGRDR
jgi:hypothetical protein